MMLCLWQFILPVRDKETSNLKPIHLFLFTAHADL